MTTDDYTMYHLTFAKEDLEKVVEIESDRFQNLDYAKPAFQTEASTIYGEYRISVAQPLHLLFEKLQDLAYDAHPYKHTTIGFEAGAALFGRAVRRSTAEAFEETAEDALRRRGAAFVMRLLRGT